MPPKHEPVKTVDEYLAPFTGETKARLNQIRTLIKKTVPDGTEEVISYAIPAYKLNKNRVVYFAGYDKHLSLYPLPKSAPDSFMQELETYKAGRGTARFYHSKPLPIDFITKFVEYRVQDSLKGE